MEAIFFLIPLSIGIIFMAIIAFVWSVHNGQYEDMDKEASRILLDDTNNSK